MVASDSFTGNTHKNRIYPFRLMASRDLIYTARKSIISGTKLFVTNCSGSSWRSGAQAPYRSRLGWSAGAFRHVLSSHTGSSLLYLVWELRSHPFYLIKSLCNCTCAAPMSSVPSVKRSTPGHCYQDSEAAVLFCFVRRIWAHKISLFVPRPRDVAHPGSGPAWVRLRMCSGFAQACCHT